MTFEEASIDELEALVQAETQYQRYNQIEQIYTPDGPFAIERYPKHREIFEAGPKYRHRCFMGGNGVGKSYGVGGFEVACHLTGRYPFWWAGITFDRPIPVWVCGDTRETVRDIMQAILLGDFAKEGPEALGTGLIPRDCIGKPHIVGNTGGSCDFVPIRHVSGGWSMLSFKAYEQGRRAFQGTKIPFILLDEEPPMAIFQECLQRGRKCDGRILLTFTPLTGFTDVVEMFLGFERRNKEGGSIISISCAWDDVPHLDEDWKRQTLVVTPVHLRDARRRGIPTAGIGAVYPVEEDHFTINPIPIPTHWRRVFGFDHGWFNTAAVWGAYDKDNDTVYIYADYKRGELPIEVHAAALRARGAWIPGVGDAALRESDGKQIIDKYKALGVNLRLPNKAVDAGIQEVLSRLSDGRLKIFSTCQKLLDEVRRYRYNEKGQIVKENDHLLDAVRYMILSGLKIAEAAPRATTTTANPVTFG